MFCHLTSLHTTPNSILLAVSSTVVGDSRMYPNQETSHAKTFLEGWNEGTLFILIPIVISLPFIYHNRQVDIQSWVFKLDFSL